MDPLTGILSFLGIFIGAIGAYYARKQVIIAQEQKKHLPSPNSPVLVASRNNIIDIYAGDFDDSNYRAWLSEEIGYIDVRGIRIGTTQAKNAMRFPILDLYTELNVQQGLTNWDLDQGNLGAGQRISLTNVLESTRCVAVAGDPGSGKTTFLRYAAKKYLRDHVNILPVFIDLPDVYNFEVKKNNVISQHVALKHPGDIEPDVIIQYLMHLSAKEDLRFTPDGLQHRISEGECIFLLDSLDELPSPEVRERVVETITKASRRWGKCKFVIASRPLALTGKAIPIDFEVVGIESLQNEEILNFLTRWSSQLFSDAPRQKNFYQVLYSTIIENQQLRSLARNPVMLTCMAVLYFNNRQLPAGRADLLEAVIQWLISSRDSSLRPSKETASFIAARYSELALAMFELETGSKNRVGRQWAATTIVKHFENDVALALDFINREENQTGLLVSRGEGDLSFWHSWFLEYLAAKEISSKTDDENTGWWNIVRQHLGNAQWSEVLALVPACLNRLGSNRTDLFFERICKTCLNENLPVKVKTLGFSGRILRDLIIAGYDLGEVRLWNTLLDDISPIFSTPLYDIAIDDRYEAAVAYGLSGDKRLQNLEECLITIPLGVFLMGAQSTDSDGANYDEFANPWEGPVVEKSLDGFDIGKYPIAVKEYKIFIEQSGYLDDSYWSKEGWRWRVENDIRFPGGWDSQLLYPNCPVTSISWFEANAFCRWLSKVKGESRYEFSLPTEVEWEYVARRGIRNGQRFPWGNHMSDGDSAECNWGGCNLRKKSPVGMFPVSNTIDGICDMFGNVEEWCGDSWRFQHDFSPESPTFDNESERQKVVRGGSTIRYMRLCRATYRSKTAEDQRYQTIGFRIVRKQALSGALQ
jgi:formylglycine-generating enzyme required for sulfatase activity